MELSWYFSESPLYPSTLTIKENKITKTYSTHDPNWVEALKKIKCFIEKPTILCPRKLSKKAREEEIPRYANKILEHTDDPTYEKFRNDIINVCMNLKIGETITNADIRGLKNLNIDQITNGDGVRAVTGLLICRGIMEMSDPALHFKLGLPPAQGHKYIRAIPQVCQWLQRNDTGAFVCTCPSSLFTYHYKDHKK